MESFEAVYSRHLDAVFRYAVRCVGRRAVAEEITADAFLELYKNFERIETDRLPAWLFTVVKRKAIDYWRRSELERRHENEAEAPVQLPELPGEASLFGFHQLKPVHRICLILRYVHGMNRREIARETGLSQMQIKSCLQYGLRLLRTALEGGTSMPGNPQNEREPIAAPGAPRPEAPKHS